MSTKRTSVDLVAHPTCGDLEAAGAVSVQVTARTQAVNFTYDLRSGVPIKSPGLCGEQTGRFNELWFRTCCELFIRDPLHPGPYLEFNFSPAGDWASYAFDHTLRGMRSHRWPGAVQAPKISQMASDSSRHRLVVEVSIPRVAIGACTQWYPTVVLETMAGVSLWAIWHPIDRPHFHHPDNFLRALEIP
ncbi:MAG: hypothetical protein ACKOBU_08110 [Gammaproteobacteria bacterium]